jgi:hypothetical protein
MPALINLEFTTSTRASTKAPRLLGLGFLLCAAGMVPWLAVLALTLPSATRVPHWSAAWVGLDALEALGLAATGWLVRRGDPRRCLPAVATAALLIADAWFDISTAGTGGPLIEAIVMAACAEIPAAVLCAVIAWRAIPGQASNGQASNG